MITSWAFFRLEVSVFEDSFSKNFHHTTNSDRLRSASFIGFSKAQWGAARWLMGTSVERERGVIPAYLNN